MKKIFTLLILVVMNTSVFATSVMTQSTIKRSEITVKINPDAYNWSTAYRFQLYWTGVNNNLIKSKKMRINDSCHSESIAVNSSVSHMDPHIFAVSILGVKFYNACVNQYGDPLSIIPSKLLKNQRTVIVYTNLFSGASCTCTGPACHWGD